MGERLSHAAGELGGVVDLPGPLDGRPSAEPNAAVNLDDAVGTVPELDAAFPTLAVEVPVGRERVLAPGELVAESSPEHLHGGVEPREGQPDLPSPRMLPDGLAGAHAALVLLLPARHRHGAPPCAGV